MSLHSFSREDDSIFLVGVGIDITERKKIEQELSESIKSFELFAALAPVGIVISDCNQKIIYTSKKFTDIPGYTKEDLASVEDWWLFAYPAKFLERKFVRTEKIQLQRQRKQILILS